MSEIEQDLILFFKLYLLRRSKNYINYFADARILAKWFDFEMAHKIELAIAPIYCNTCFSRTGECYGGTFTYSCGYCHGGGSNVAYELQELSRHCNISWELCIYLFVRAIEDIYKSGNANSFHRVIHR